MIENPNVICNDCAYCKQNKELCKKIDELYDNIDIWIAENTKLKQLLKECKDVMDKAGFMFAKIDDVKKAKRLLKRIDEVLGEE